MSETVRAPELHSDLGWLNTDRPLSFSGELSGQVVVLDFWTYCCINCMHILPDLAFLEHKYHTDPVTFIGVHSAKFSNEASRETIRAAILRYEIQHPVVVDDQMKLWQSYAVRSWPTLVVIDPTGRIVGTLAGEGNREALDKAIAQTLELGRRNGTLANEPITVRREANVRAASGLAFPGKVLVSEEVGGMYVADSNHNRIVIAELPQPTGRARIVRVVGTGKIGRDDGPADAATFNHPQGLALGQGNLYVADTENHLIRAIDLSTFEVTTIVGTGEMTNDRAGGLMGTQQGLNSPWDLAIEGSTLYVAMAGTHQIWRVDLPIGFARALAGTGRENIVDGPTETAALSQPSGLCLLGGTIYFADSEVSAIRGIDLAAENVFTVIGEGLFSFGDVDGHFPEAKLQHPLGLDAWGRALLVTDTYNHKIKLVDPQSRSVRTLYGTGEPGTSTPQGKVAFFEPGGLSVGHEHIYVADTNNHRIVWIHLTTHQWQEIFFDGLTTPCREGEAVVETIALDPVFIASGRDIELILDITLPEQMHISPEAPWSVRVSTNGATFAQQTGKSDALPLRVTIPARSVPNETPWNVYATFAYCTEDDRGMCVPAELTWTLPVSTGKGAATITLAASVGWEAM